MQSGIVGAPATFRVDGEQYIAFMTSKGGVFPMAAGIAGGVARKVPNIPRLVVLKIGGSQKLPASPDTTLAWNSTCANRLGGADCARQGTFWPVLHGLPRG